MKRAAVLGHPIGHSLSPRLHGYWLKKYGIEGEYSAIDTPPEKLADTLSQLNSEGYAGVNLTVPLKETVLPLLDEITPLAAQIGAANTVTFHAGKMRGDNTDAYGFIENLRSVGDLTPYLTHCVVLGAGGAARAVVAGLLGAGAARITLINRDRKKAESLAAGRAAIQVEDWEKRDQAIENATLLVNATSLGMKGQPELPLDLKWLPVNALVTDIVYNPLQTMLLKQAAARGNQTVDGLGMLIHQAVPAFKAFFATQPETDTQLRHELIT